MGLTYHHLDLPTVRQKSAVAIGVSGGPDSLALAWLLKEWAVTHDIKLHILTVDHQLRAEGAAEARIVADIVRTWPQTIHTILEWTGPKPQTGLLEEARKARYALMTQYCTEHTIEMLFLAHHQDDQAETFLLRLAKGSGVDGLSGMLPTQERSGIILVRPLLNLPKDDLVAVCQDNDLAFVRDPTNENTAYTRPRLRAAKAALEEEGLSAKRLATTAMRMARARQALEYMAEQTHGALLKDEAAAHWAYDLPGFRAAPPEMAVRLLQKAQAQISTLSRDYPPRLEKIEQLAADIQSGRQEAAVTLGGCLFVPDDKNGLLWIKREVT